MGPTNRVVVLIDMDCFYCQVEEKLNPKLEGKPIAVVQYNAWRGGGIIAVNYPARDEGVTRHMRGNEAKRKCPSINLVQVPELRGKADLTKYRDAGKRVADVLATFTPLLQRASVDEAYLDITEAVEKRIETSLSDLKLENLANTYVVGSDLKDFIENVLNNKEFSFDNLKLAFGGLITEEIRREVFVKTGYKCSAGIAHNKILAKLVCSLHKPNKQTILPQDAVPDFFQTMQINKIKNLGGKFGQTLSNDFKITYMGQLANIPEKDLARKYDEKTANWLHNIAKGIDTEPVTTKLIAKSIACCKNFTGRAALTTAESVEHWLNQLAAEMSERLDKDSKENNRKAKQIIVSFAQEINKKDINSSRTTSLPSHESKKIAQAALSVVRKFCLQPDGSYLIKYLGLNASNFENIRKVREITSFFQAGSSKQTVRKATLDNSERENFDPNEMEVIDENVYNQPTQELEQNCEDLIFYDDSYRVKNDEDSSSEGTNNIEENFNQHENYNNYENNSSKPMSSFFSKYFQDSPKQSPVKNATVIPLEEEAEQDEVPEEEPKEICSECKKSIPIAEFPSHQDYHLALQISKSEKPIQQKPDLKVSNQSGKKSGTRKGLKRKIESNNNPLALFLKKETEEEYSSDLTETCEECNKRIKIEEVESHKDYHTAKKLHQEINSIKPVVIPKTNTPKSKNTKSKNQSTNRSVISFFQTS